MGQPVVIVAGDQGATPETGAFEAGQATVVAAIAAEGAASALDVAADASTLAAASAGAADAAEQTAIAAHERIGHLEAEMDDLRDEVVAVLSGDRVHAALPELDDGAPEKVVEVNVDASTDTAPTPTKARSGWGHDGWFGGR